MNSNSPSTTNNLMVLWSEIRIASKIPQLLDLKILTYIGMNNSVAEITTPINSIFVGSNSRPDLYLTFDFIIVKNAVKSKTVTEIIKKIIQII